MERSVDCRAKEDLDCKLIYIIYYRVKIYKKARNISTSEMRYTHDNNNNNSSIK